MATTSRFFRPLIILWLILASGDCFAFGADGHRIVVLIAQNHISEKTAAAINSIVDYDDLSELSLWPDKIRHLPNWRQSRYWHYVSIDDGEEFSDFNRHSDGDVLSALDYFYGQLQNPELSRQQRRESLLFFSHFVADIHQPLHVGRRADRGGNAITVKWPDQNKTVNLHQVWDSLILNTENKTPQQYSRYLLRHQDQHNNLHAKQWRQSQFVDWARESKALRHQVYGFAQPQQTRGTLTTDYIERSKTILEQRLLIAGLRLADYLNRIFDPDGQE